MAVFKPVRLELEAYPLDVSTFGGTQEIQKIYKFEGNVGNRETAITVINAFFDELEK